MTRLTYGGIAQLARAFGSYPECRWFESNCRYQFWPGGQEVKTPPFHGGNTSSILVRVTRATKQMSQSADQKFVRSGFWHLYFLGRVAQLVRALASHARGPRFESVRVHHEKSTCVCKCFFQRNKSLSGFVKCPAGVKYACGVWNRCGGEDLFHFTWCEASNFTIHAVNYFTSSTARHFTLRKPASEITLRRWGLCRVSNRVPANAGARFVICILCVAVY